MTLLLVQGLTNDQLAMHSCSHDAALSPADQMSTPGDVAVH